MKWFIRIGAAVLVLLILAVVGVYIYIDTIAESAIEEGATYATGVPTSLDGASVGIFAGGLDIDGLQIDNPQGFDAEYFLRLGRGETEVSLGSLMEDTVEIPRLFLSDLTLNLQQSGDTANYQVILDNLAKLSGPEPAPTGDQKGYKVGRILIQNVTVNAEVMGQTIRDVTIDKIRLENVGSDTETGVLLSELQGTIMKAVLEAIAKNPDALPGLMAAGLQQGLAQVGQITDVGEQVIGEITTRAGEVLGNLPGGEGVTGEVEKTREKADRAIQDAGKAIGNLLGGNKKPEEQPAE